MGKTKEIVLVNHPGPSQQKFLNSTAKFKGFCGPVGSGKSLALVYEAIQLSIQNKGCMGLIGAPTYKRLRDTVEKEFLTQVRLAEIPYQWKKQEHKLIFTSFDSEIIFRAVDDFDSLRGTNLAWFGLDEMTYCPEGAFLQLQARMRDPKAKRRCGFGVFTPNGFDWVWQRFVNDKNPDFDLVRANKDEVKWLAEDYYDTLASSYDSRFYQQEVLAEFLNINSGRCYESFTREKHIKEVELDPRLPICWSLDFNLNPACSVVAQVVDESTAADLQRGKRKCHLYVFDELYLHQATTPQVCEEFLHRLPKYPIRHDQPVRVHVYGDATGSQRQRSTAGAVSDWDAVRHFLGNNNGTVSSQYHIREANPLVKDRVAAVNGMLQNYNKEIRMTIDPRCKSLIKDLERVSWLEGGGAVMDKSESDLTHVSDALGYLCHTEFPPGGGQVGYRSERLF